jgi:hypothetical protein
VKDGIDWAEVGAGGRFEKIVSTLLSCTWILNGSMELAAMVAGTINGAPATA